MDQDLISDLRPTIWNSLSDELQSSTYCNESFQKALKTFFFCRVIAYAVHEKLF